MNALLDHHSFEPENPVTKGARTDRKVVLPGQTPEGEHILSVLVKRTYNIQFGRQCVRADEDRRLNAADVFYADPMNSSVEFESDFVPFKLATDVVFNGKVYAPGGSTVPSLTAELAVGNHKKVVRVTGDRVCRYRPGLPPIFSEPTPFAVMDLRYERAYGGVDIYSDKLIPFPYMRNPLGRGFTVKNMEKTIQCLELPNIEDPANLLTPERLCCNEFMAWEQQPMPAGLGWLPRTWLPRSQLAGVLPADREVERQLREIYTKFVPREHRGLYAKTELPAMNFRFFNGASSGLVLPFLKGDEMIRTASLTLEGQSSFYLPAEGLKIGIDIGGGTMEPEIVLHTVMIRMEDKQVDLVWRAAAPYPGPDWLPQIRKMDVLVQ